MKEKLEKHETTHREKLRIHKSYLEISRNETCYWRSEIAGSHVINFKMKATSPQFWLMTLRGLVKCIKCHPGTLAKMSSHAKKWQGEIQLARRCEHCKKGGGTQIEYLGHSTKNVGYSWKNLGHKVSITCLQIFCNLTDGWRISPLPNWAKYLPSLKHMSQEPIFGFQKGLCYAQTQFCQSNTTKWNSKQKLRVWVKLC